MAVFSLDSVLFPTTKRSGAGGQYFLMLKLNKYPKKAFIKQTLALIQQ